VTRSFQKISHSSKLQVAALTNGSCLQSETGPPIKNGPLLITSYYIMFLRKIKLIIGSFYNIATVKNRDRVEKCGGIIGELLNSPKWMGIN